jgi:hypothetical protein
VYSLKNLAALPSVLFPREIRYPDCFGRKWVFTGQRGTTDVRESKKMSSWTCVLIVAFH